MVQRPRDVYHPDRERQHRAMAKAANCEASRRCHLAMPDAHAAKKDAVTAAS